MDARRLVARFLLAGASAAGLAVGVAVQATPAGASTANQASASTLYKDALATTHAWSVHYDSTSTASSQTLVESGDAGPASASQTVTMGQGTISILVFGGTSYVKGNTDGLESLAGLSSSQAAEAAGQWIQFSTDNTAFAPVVEGVRSTDIAKELALSPRSPWARHAHSTASRSMPSTGPRSSARSPSPSSSMSVPVAPTFRWRRTQ